MTANQQPMTITHDRQDESRRLARVVVMGCRWLVSVMSFFPRLATRSAASVARRILTRANVECRTRPNREVAAAVGRERLGARVKNAPVASSVSTATTPVRSPPRALAHPCAPPRLRLIATSATIGVSPESPAGRRGRAGRTHRSCCTAASRSHSGPPARTPSSRSRRACGRSRPCSGGGAPACRDR